jgi:hypothetical protein
LVTAYKKKGEKKKKEKSHVIFFFFFFFLRRVDTRQTKKKGNKRLQKSRERTHLTFGRNANEALAVGSECDDRGRGARTFGILNDARIRAFHHAHARVGRA